MIRRITANRMNIEANGYVTLLAAMTSVLISKPLHCVTGAGNGADWQWRQRVRPVVAL
jgi:hypothetical protein